MSCDPTSVQNFNENVRLYTAGTDTVDVLCRRFVRWPAYLEYKALGITGTGLIDTAAKRSIAGSSLYALLVKRGQKFRSSKMTVKLADGSVNNINVKLADPIDLMSFILLGVKLLHTIECASTDVLRIDEGTMLSPPERDDLARLPQEYQDILHKGRTDDVCGTSH
ncbi:hypothetical protein EVAR_25711_1 [Eumeta japonica]|uniref:Uncharacterized protein n=1 Tax=Eumeta variegata TaxID=151549 RepID=A0A4C1YVM3_EUMVA|nr:hypothetical protein EVAR_25711_1 [Eumeta japonica]